VKRTTFLGAHVHYGACTAYLGHFQYHHPGPSTRENEIWLDLDQPLSLVVHRHSNPDVGHPGPRIACGNFALSE
jgi:hypothetical protein